MFGWFLSAFNSKCKNFLKKVLGKVCLGYDGTDPIICEMQNVTHSRPLIYLSDKDCFEADMRQEFIY